MMPKTKKYTKTAKAAKPHATYGTKVSMLPVPPSRSKDSRIRKSRNDFERQAQELQERYLGSSAHKDNRRKQQKGAGIVFRAPILPDRLTSAITAHQQSFDPFFADLDSSLECAAERSNPSSVSAAKVPANKTFRSSKKTSSMLTSNMYEVLAESDDEDKKDRGIVLAPSILAADSAMPKTLSLPQRCSSSSTNIIEYQVSHAKHEFIPAVDITDCDDDL